MNRVSQKDLQSPPKTIESYITKTLSAEQQVADTTGIKRASNAERKERKLRAKLQKLLEKDDKKSAIKIAYRLMPDNGEDDELDILYDFLMERIGVQRRDPVFSMSLTPAVLWVSGISVTALALFAVTIFLGPGELTKSQKLDLWSVGGLALLVGIPLWDLSLASLHNYINRYRLKP
ncbi:MAG: hypothetical protein ABJZ55_11605 [Fuerstiella sp.]